MTDYSGNSGTASTTYNVELGGSGGGGPSGGTTPSTDKKTNQWTKITPGAATIMKNFNPAIGLKEIQITVNNNAQNVKITVTKYDSKPASVIVEKTGKVYKYLEIKEENLKEKLSKAVIKTQVLKSWMENQGLKKGDIALFKFDNSTSNWKELVTTLMGEDDNYYYYDAEVTSFSYFAIGDKISEIPASEEESVTPTSSEEGEEKSKSVWLWAIVITMAVVIAVVGWVILSKKKRR
jgi:PGF-pre-PGF domain-containing protein